MLWTPDHGHRLRAIATLARALVPLACAMLALSSCGDMGGVPEEAAPHVLSSTGSDDGAGGTRAGGRPVTQEEIDIALWGGPFIQPLQKWRPKPDPERASEVENDR